MTSGTHALILAQSAFEAVCKERDEAREELQQWKMLCLWGGTPEHIDQFIRGQQSRIHEAQEIELVCEQLERERDEAREQRKTMRELHNKNAATHNELRELCSSLRADRDDLRKQIEAMREAINAANVGLQSAMQYILSLPYFGNLEELETTEKVQAAIAKLKPLLP